MREKDIIEKNEWDVYWGNKRHKSNKLYDFIAKRYRNLVLVNYLSFFIRSEFSKGQVLLHAGCGGGQVDQGIRNFVEVTALDISPNALELYRSVFGKEVAAVEGSIFKLPFPDKSFDGVYNLGVMEHFTEAEIQAILSEFYRVLKPGGKIILFWPPVFGLTVMVLDCAHFILNKIFARNVQLHPAEITRVTSKKQVFGFVEKASFKPLKYYFGLKDLFTQVTVVAQK